jgi:2-hydroxychromene-2-carboxylate isomerase
MKIVEAYFDFASPWSYVASAIAARKLPGRTIDWKPIYIRGLEAFSQGVPYVGPKLDYLMRDLQRCAAHEGVALLPPVTFPIDGLQSLRGAIVARQRGKLDRYREAIFRAAWAEQRDISDKSLVVALLAEATGETSAALADAIASQSVKDNLRANTEEAKSRGAFGVPTFFVGDEMFWGHDRLDYVARAT